FAAPALPAIGAPPARLDSNPEESGSRAGGMHRLAALGRIVRVENLEQAYRGAVAAPAASARFAPASVTAAPVDVKPAVIRDNMVKPVSWATDLPAEQPSSGNPLRSLGGANAALGAGNPLR